MLMQIDGTFVFVVISFLIFLFIIKTILYNPIERVMDEREKFYFKNSKMENDSKQKSENLILERDNALNEARKEAQTYIKELVQKENDLSALKIKQTIEENQGLIEKNKEQLIYEANEAKNEVKNEVNSIVESIVSKVLGKNVELNLDEGKIKEYLKI